MAHILMLNCTEGKYLFIDICHFPTKSSFDVVKFVDILFHLYCLLLGQEHNLLVSKHDKL